MTNPTTLPPEQRQSLRALAEATIRANIVKMFVNPQVVLDLLGALESAEAENERLEAGWFKFATITNGEVHPSGSALLRELEDTRAALADAQGRNLEIVCAYCGWVGQRGSDDMIQHVKECIARLNYREQSIKQIFGDANMACDNVIFDTEGTP